MNQLTQAYLDLQEVDQKIIKLKTQAKSESDQIMNEKAAYKKLDASITNIREVLKKSKAEYELKKLDLASACEKRDKLGEKLQKITNNKEYKAIEKESRTYREEADALTRFLSASEENLAKLGKSLTADEEELKQKKNLIKELLLKAQNEKAHFEKEIKELTALRDERAIKIQALEDNVDKDQRFLETYQKLLKLPNGDMITLMVNGICQGCFMSVNTQIASKIKSLKKIELCTSCHRLLYVED